MPNQMPKKDRKKRAAVERTKFVKVSDPAALGALIRVLRLRMGFSQIEAAELLGVGRRWYNDLENGKETIRVGMIFAVLECFNCSLAISGPGAEFTVEELERTAVIKGREHHVWEAELMPSKTPKGAAPEEPPHRGHRRGHIKLSTKLSTNSVKPL